MAAKNDIQIGRRKRGFERAASLVSSRVRTAGESRGFAVSRLLTHWSEIVGQDVAARARPVEVTYGRGFGATLTLLTTGAQAPVLEMQKESIREKVNACYGYAAISKVRVTQTALSGFSEGRVAFEHASDQKVAEDPELPDAVRKIASNVGDEALRGALEKLGAHILSKKTEE